MRRAATVPVALPVVRVDAAASGALTVTVDGDPWSSPTTPHPTTDDLPQLLAEISARLDVSLRVEFTAADGQTVTEVITPADPAQTDPATEARRAGERPIVFGVIGSGFEPGENVSIAVVVSTCTASDDGVAGLRLPPALLARKPGPLILLGTGSGRVVVSDPGVAQAGAA
ncbi:hypothetical protein Xcel_0801 [Xylanimonas cellulosilytica DSM 15894]|uniref:Uncharacterized protein n=1 Tax=Xylanimonas cellulosilytica (strain DSM 15894 / JCM 12276 / CECT 5975 / KCTC 9989 / LMG 20990 / NBRC 107835 / XIL07) TaxID=446471 RepID=D1BXM9_XYLCX|nr:hypothetical protein [Xylanimonas cellulosilytica]ACZ29839.1 hypothetical protein Xcel_0801 [Xylanimonas cellulosilytica DSM 15894]